VIHAAGYTTSSDHALIPVCLQTDSCLIAGKGAAYKRKEVVLVFEKRAKKILFIMPITLEADP
jgi:hypothetical protein